MTQISPHISLEEATQSDTAVRHGISNIPDSVIIEKMKIVATECFEKIRNHFNKPIKVNSFYRCEALNTAVKGSKTSQHVKGEAIDMSAPSGSTFTNKDIHDWAKANLVFDQLIWEYGTTENPAWVHISFCKGSNRNQCLIIK